MGAAYTAAASVVGNKFFSDQEGHIEDQYKDAQRAQQEGMDKLLKDKKNEEDKIKANRRRAIQAVGTRTNNGSASVMTAIGQLPGNYTPKTLLGQ
jgi:hypothetical protein